VGFGPRPVEKTGREEATLKGRGKAMKNGAVKPGKRKLEGRLIVSGKK